MPGFGSIRYDDQVQQMQLQLNIDPEENEGSDDEDYSGDQEQFQIPPPPMLHGTDITQLFFRELVQYSDESDETMICD
jgi:hypothetical protein